jgi:PDZ domain
LTRWAKERADTLRPAARRTERAGCAATASISLETKPIVGQDKLVPMMSRKQLEEIAEAVRGVPVWGCLPGSTAAEAGVRYGDIVLSVNGVDTPSIAEYLAARELRSDGFTLRLFRAGEELTVFVPFRVPSEPLAVMARQVADGRYVDASGDDLGEPEPKSPPS